MKNVIIKFLGLDKIQQENEYLMNKVDNLSKDLYDKDWTHIASNAIDYSSLAENIDAGDVASYVEAESIAEHIDAAELAEYIDAESVAHYVDAESVAEHIDSNDLSRYIEPYEVAKELDINDVMRGIDVREIAELINMDSLIEHANINIDTLAEQVAQRIADRDGMVELVSEEVSNQGVTMDEVKAMVLDFVGDPIEHRIREAILNTEVMVSAKLNINK
jgi:hypothetical protein